MNDTQGGTAWELATAGEQMVAARRAGDPEAEVLALIRFADGLRNSSVGVVGQVVSPLADQIKALAEIVTNARQHDLTWRTEERQRRDAQSTRLYEELDKLIAASEESARGLGKIDHRVDAVVARLDVKRVTIADHEQRITALESNNTRLEALEDAIAALRAASIVERDG